MAKRIVFSKRAFIDIDRITDFNTTRNQSDTYSRNFVIKLNKRLRSLLKHPLSGVKTDEDAFLLVWDQYYIFYSCDDFLIEIKAIYHQKEDAPL